MQPLCKMRSISWCCRWMIWILALCAGGLKSPAASNTDADAVDGTALARELRTQKPPDNLATKGTLKLRNAAGQRTEIPLKFELVLRTNGWHTLYETCPANGAPAISLTVRHFEQGSNAYMLTGATNLQPATLQPLPANDPLLWQPFAGSDFALADLGLEFFHWPRQQIVKTDLRRGRRFSVLESRHDLESVPYARVLSWIDPGTGGLLRAEAYDAAGRLVKEFSVRSVKRGQLKEMQIRNLITHSLTRIEFDLEMEGLPEDAE
jgi:hypothetical protein